MISTENTKQGRPWIIRSRSLISLLILAPFAVLVSLSAPLVSEETLVDFLSDTAGWGCFVAGATFRWWATLYVGGRKGQELAIYGPYSITRNPLYFGTFLLTLSIAFFLHSATFAVGLLVATPMYLSVTVPWEEQKLRERFGTRFDAYKRQVPKFVPRFTMPCSPKRIRVNVNGLMTEFHIALRWMWIPILAQTVSHLREQTWWPALIHLP